MNKIFKVIYSKTKHMYVVASELAKSHSKSSSSIDTVYPVCTGSYRFFTGN